MSRVPGGTRARLRAHFLANLGRVMNSDELRAVAGISKGRDGCANCAPKKAI